MAKTLSDRTLKQKQKRKNTVYSFILFIELQFISSRVPVHNVLSTGPVPVYNVLFTGPVPVHNVLFTGPVPVHNVLLTGIVPVHNFFLYY